MENLFYINRVFDDFEALAEQAKLWNVQMTQLNRGKSVNTLKQLSLEKVKFSNILFNGHKTTVGDPPPGKTIALYSGDQKSKLVWRNKKVQQNQVLIFPDGAEHDVMTHGDNIRVLTITFPETVWSDFISDNETRNLHKLSSSHEVVSLPESEIIRFKNSLLTPFNMIEESPHLLNFKLFQSKVEEQTLLAVTRAFSVAQQNYSSQISRKTTYKDWAKIELILKKAGASALSVQELSQATGVSSRSLRRLFRERYDISPKAYLNRVRLNRVRSELKQLTSNNFHIADIANKYGFWHMGQFAADYRNVFGELPSETFSNEVKIA